jgi:hypothetical protein
VTERSRLVLLALGRLGADRPDLALPASRLGVSRPAGALAALEERGLVSKHQRPGRYNWRPAEWWLTGAGAAWVERHLDRLRGWEEASDRAIARRPRSASRGRARPASAR